MEGIPTEILAGVNDDLCSDGEAPTRDYDKVAGSVWKSFVSGSASYGCVVTSLSFTSGWARMVSFVRMWQQVELGLKLIMMVKRGQRG
jgi:hypothetical protein